MKKKNAKEKKTKVAMMNDDGDIKKINKQKKLDRYSKV